MICGWTTAQDKSTFNGIDMEKIVELRNYYRWTANYASQKKFDSANRYSNRAMELALSLNNDEMVGYAKVCNARALYWQRDVEKAKGLLHENLANDQLHDTIKIRSYFLISDIYNYEKDFLSGVEANINAEKTIRKAKTLTQKDSMNLSLVYSNLGNLHREIKEFDQAHSYFRNALAYNVDKGMDSYLLYYRSELYDDEDKINKAIDMTREAIKIVTHDRKDLFLPTYYLALSNYYHKLNKADSAVYFGKKGLVDNTYCQLDLLHNAVANGYFMLKDYPVALQYYKNALEESTAPSFDTTVHRNLSKTYTRLKNYEKALTHNAHYVKLKDSLDELKVKQEIVAITQKYEASKKQVEIEKLNYENAQSELVIKEQKAKLTLITIVLFFLFLLVFVVYYFFINQKKQKHLLFIKNSELAKELKQKQAILVKPKSKEDPSKIHDEQREKIHSAIEKLMEGDFYLDADMTLAKLARLIDTNTTYLSKVINEDYEKSFATFLNELRLSYTLESLESEPTFRRLTIDHIAEKSGFASSSTFYNAFKKFTGLTPSYYIKKRLVQPE
ncbi:MAG: hypothetical protein Aureis2KO_18940 [Aureisphaera sp.]